MRVAEKKLLLQILDQRWNEHLLALDHLRQGIDLRGYGQRDPLNEYKREAFDLFEQMMTRLSEQVIQLLAHIEIRQPEPPTPDRPGSAIRNRRHAGAAGPAGATAAGGDGGRRRRCRRQQSRGLEERQPQRGLPVRVGQEVQALPRQVRLTQAITAT